MKAWVQILLLALVFSGCTKKETGRTPASIAPVQKYVKVLSDPIMTPVRSDNSSGEKSKMISLSLSYIGDEGLEAKLIEHAGLVENLIRTSVANMKFVDVLTEEGKSQIQDKVLDSLNEFIAGNMFITIKVEELREI